MMNPEIVTAIGLMLLFTSLNIKTGFMTLLLAHIAFCIPYVMLSIMPKLRQMDLPPAGSRVGSGRDAMAGSDQGDRSGDHAGGLFPAL